MMFSETNSISVHDFAQEVSCTYKEERYMVRDNGAILRCQDAGKRKRAIDNQWTFGKVNIKNGYMEIACVPIHRIVAVAFLDTKPTPNHVVDHIDTNRRNNRPENLRWVTRLENILLNPITAKRIVNACGSVEAFLADPSKFRDTFLEPNYEWMCTVSAEEAQLSLERMLAWAQSDKQPSGGSLGEWIFIRGAMEKQPLKPISEYTDIIMAKTINAAQRDWRTPSEFPCCPQDYTGEPLIAYAEKLEVGSPFCSNNLYSSVVFKSALSEDCQSLFVISKCEDAIKEWGLAQITFEDGLFMHTSLHNFFTQEGAEKQYTLAQGLEWTGEDSVDDYC